MFQLSLGILGVLTLGLLNRLLIEEIQLPAAVAALAIGAQELMGFSRAFFGNWSDRLPLGGLRRTPFLLASALERLRYAARVIAMAYHCILEHFVRLFRILHLLRMSK